MKTIDKIIKAVTCNGMRAVEEEGVIQCMLEYAELMVKHDRKRIKENLKKHEKSGGWMNYDEMEGEFLDTPIELL